MEHTHEEKIGNYLIRIFPDTTPDSPRNWDNLGTMVCFHKRYDLGDENDYCSSNYDGWDEMKEDIIEKENVHTILPLYLYDHSGITISTSPFGCQWDSGQVGWIFVSKDKVKQESLDETKIEEYLKGEVETYDQYIRGDVYGYKVYKIETCDKGCEHEEELDSCWGFYGEEDCITDAKGIVDYYLRMPEVKEVV
jgi:hypothetical protein